MIIIILFSLFFYSFVPNSSHAMTSILPIFGALELEFWLRYIIGSYF